MPYRLPSSMNREPLAMRAAIVAAVTAIIGVIVTFGVDIPVEQQTAILTVVGSLAAMFVALWSRGSVTPVDDPHDEYGDPLTNIEADVEVTAEDMDDRLDWMEISEDEMETQ